MSDAKKIGRQALAQEQARAGTRKEPRSPLGRVWAGMVDLATKVRDLERRLAKLEAGR